MQKAADARNNGFTDAHVHVSAPEGIDSARAAGIAALRNAGMVMNDDARKERSGCIRRGRDPVVITSCWALYKPGGYGGRFGVPVASRDDMRREIHRLKNAGADIIKVMASGLVSLKEPGSVTAGGFSSDELRLIVEDGASLGLGVMAHANGEAAIAAAVESGVRSVEHGFFMTERALEAMARRGTYWTPTVGALVRAAESRTISNEMKTYVAALIASQLEMIGKAREIGVPLAVGTDCVLPDPEYRKSYDAELSYFERSGISREDVLHIACEGGAKLLGM